MYSKLKAMGFALRRKSCVGGRRGRNSRLVMMMDGMDGSRGAWGIGIGSFGAEVGFGGK
jgi:hypothetical protein